MSYCDFCNVFLESFEKGWTYRTKPNFEIKIPGIPFSTIDDGLWLACDDCATMIEQGDQKGLEDRAVELSNGSFPNVSKKDLKFVIQSFHNGFWKNKQKEEEYQ
jgi:hypothetical protein